MLFTKLEITKVSRIKKIVINANFKTFTCTLHQHPAESHIDPAGCVLGQVFSNSVGVCTRTVRISEIISETRSVVLATVRFCNAHTVFYIPSVNISLWHSISCRSSSTYDSSNYTSNYASWASHDGSKGRNCSPYRGSLIWSYFITDAIITAITCTEASARTGGIRLTAPNTA